jgi:hypothetical protein
VLAPGLELLLKNQGEFELAAQVPQLRIVDRCLCRGDFCSSFNTRPKPEGSYGEYFYNAGPLPTLTSFWNSGSSRRQSRSESLAAQFRLLYPEATAFLNVSRASVFLPRTP